MGQYYRQINLDKEQLLYTHSFGDGLKLLEFGQSSCGTLTAMAILLADGNGRGGGDLHLDRVENQELINLANKIIGSWAGDRIVIAGDYADPKKFINRRKYKAPVLQAIADDCYSDGYNKASRVNLYHLAVEKFEDISWKVLAVMCTDDYILETMTEKYNSKIKYRDDSPFVEAFKLAAKVNPKMKEVVIKDKKVLKS